MARLTVDNIQSKVASLVDQDENTSNLDSTDYSLRLTYLNRSLFKWAEIQDWQVLFKEYNMAVSTSTGNASVVLPNNFRKLAGYPKITFDGTNTADYAEVLPQNDQYEKTEKRVWILGNPNSGYILRVFGATLASGASVKVPYFASPVSLASPADIPEIPNAEYLVQDCIAQIWESREDPRFPQAKADADRILSNMLTFENTQNVASDWGRVKTVDEIKYGTRWGE